MLRVHEIRQKIRSHSPLIHTVTNLVVAGFTANGLYAVGARPVMAKAPEEVETVAQSANAVVLNMGTPDTASIEAKLKAGRAANKAGVPVVLDPVGAGATPFRTNAIHRLLTELDIAVIRGNAGEMANLTGLDHPVSGVDSITPVDKINDIAVTAARKWNSIAVLTGKTDVVTDGETVWASHNGHPLQTSVTGTGCLLSSVTGAFLAVHTDRLEASLAAVSFYGIAAQSAAEEDHSMGPGTFQVKFLDALYKTTDETVKHKQNIRKERVR